MKNCFHEEIDEEVMLIVLLVDTGLPWPWLRGWGETQGCTGRGSGVEERHRDALVMAQGLGKDTELYWLWIRLTQD